MGCSPWNRKESGMIEKLTLTYLIPSSFLFPSQGGKFSPFDNCLWIIYHVLGTVDTHSFILPNFGKY